MVMFTGNDRSNTDMFESILSSMIKQGHHNATRDTPLHGGIRKPSKANYFLDDVSDILKLLGGLAAALSTLVQQESSSSQSLLSRRKNHELQGCPQPSLKILRSELLSFLHEEETKQCQSPDHCGLHH